MIELHVLGRTDLQGIESASAKSLLGQPRPAALLIYLAVAAPGDFHRRDHLAALFWAETDQEHARSNLRKLVHTLRKSLGDDIIETRGDEELRVPRELLWCDAAEYEDAVRAGKLMRAIELYRGPLLPGLIVTGAPGFQSWLELARRHFGRTAVKIALTLAEEHVASQELTMAGELTRFISRREPELEDEHQLRKMIIVLDRIGDRMAALRMYEDFRERLLRDYKATPSPETRKLMDEIKSR